MGVRDPQEPLQARKLAGLSQEAPAPSLASEAEAEPCPAPASPVYQVPWELAEMEAGCGGRLAREKDRAERGGPGDPRSDAAPQ